MRFTGFHLIWIAAWVCSITIVHEVFHPEWMSIPWLPVSIVGTAVAFYVGFKNNQAYDRLWEARKIWGAIVNSSRAWSSTVKAFVSNHFSNDDKDGDEIYNHVRILVHRHIAWLYTLRNQLLIPTQWEHINQSKHVRRVTEKRRKVIGVGLWDDKITEKVLQKYLPASEHDRLINYKNTATHIIDQQSQHLKKLKSIQLIDDFRHMELQQILYDFYVHQGKCERIKKFPLPRQYGGVSLIFTGIFILLLPFAMVTEFHKLGEFGAWISIPFSILIAWVYLVMELVGDYSENPFEGLGNDIPMLSLCRVIEIDLLEMIGEDEIPEAITPKNGVLM